MIPQNPTNIVTEENTSRFNGAPWFDGMRSLSILIAGVGGIGSWTALLMSRLQPHQITLFDPDRVDSSNQSGQLSSTYDIGAHKVTSVANVIHQFSSYYSIYGRSREYVAGENIAKIMISGFDNMSARTTAFQNWQYQLGRYTVSHPEHYLFIDGRLAAEELQIFAFTADDKYSQSKYADEYLFSDTDADSTICSYKQTSHIAAMIAGLITNIVTNHVNNISGNVIDRPVPFLTEYDATLMKFNTIL